MTVAGMTEMDWRRVCGAVSRLAASGYDEAGEDVGFLLDCLERTYDEADAVRQAVCDLHVNDQGECGCCRDSWPCLTLKAIGA